MVAEGMDLAIAGAVDEMGATEIARPQALVDDEVGHRDHRRDADAGRDQDDGTVARPVEDELAPWRHRLQVNADNNPSAAKIAVEAPTER